jgi:hypothetical protein
MILFIVLTKKFVKDGTSQFQNFHVNFQKFHTLFCMRLSQARLSQVLTRWVPEMLMGAHKMQSMASALTLLEQYHEDGDEFLSHVV